MGILTKELGFTSNVLDHILFLHDVNLPGHWLIIETYLVTHIQSGMICRPLYTHACRKTAKLRDYFMNGIHL